MVIFEFANHKDCAIFISHWDNDAIRTIGAGVVLAWAQLHPWSLKKVLLMHSIYTSMMTVVENYGVADKRTISKKSLETSVGIFRLSVDLEGSNFGYRDLLASREAMQILSTAFFNVKKALDNK